MPAPKYQIFGKFNEVINGKDGVGISSIEKTKTEGLVDTYTITLTDGSTYTYTVTNGKDGATEEVESRLDDIDAAIKAINDELNYAAISFTSFSMTPSTTQYELGSSVSNVSLKWALSKTPIKLTVNGADVGVSDTSYTDNSTYTANKSWTVKATEAGEKAATATKTASISFLNRIYYGAATEPAAYNSEFILGLANKPLRSSKLTSFSVTAGAEQYIYYCLPKRMGTCAFKVGGFDGGFSLVATISFENASGYTEDYYIYRSDNASLGATSVTVS